MTKRQRRTILNDNCRTLSSALPHPLTQVVLTVVFFAANAIAATPQEYKRSLQTAQTHVDELLGAIAAAEMGEPTDVTETSILTNLRNLIPPTQKIEFAGNTVETANQWLHAKLDDFGREQDTTKRAAVLTEIRERLSALVQRVNELESATAAITTKDEDKRKLAEILRREEYQKPAKQSESLFARWLREFIEWLDSLFPRPDFAPSGFNGIPSLAYFLLIVLCILIAGMIGYLAYKFAPLFSPRFRSRTKKTKEDRVIMGERIAADASSSDLFVEAERLAREGDLRGAIRKGYVAVLCELSDRKIVGLARHKTNRDYLRDVRTRKDLFENMQGLTSRFERHWYGLESAESADWDEFRQGYERVVSL